MASYVQPLVADAVVNGLAVFSLGLVVYLISLLFHERSEQRKRLQERERSRRSHWGYV